MKKILYILPFILILSLIFHLPTSQASNFKGNPHQNGLNYFVKIGVLKPDSKGKYNTKKTITRAQLAYYYSIALKLPVKNSVVYKDVNSKTTYATHIYRAGSAKILVSLSNGKLIPTSKVSNQEFAATLYKASTYLKLTIPKLPKSTFADQQSILKGYQNPVLYSQALGLIKGNKHSNGKTYFYPKTYVTIEQASTYIYNLTQEKARQDKVKAAAAKAVAEKKAQEAAKAKAEAEKKAQEAAAKAKAEAEKKAAEEKAKAEAIAAKKTFALNTISNGVLTITAKYTQLSDAPTNLSNNQVITHNGKIIKMNKGFVSLNNTTTFKAKSGDYIYAKDNYLEFVSSDGKNIAVRLSNDEIVTGLAVENFTLYPSALNFNRTFYSVNSNGNLVLTIAPPNQKLNSLIIGSAPAFMKAGQKYYSWNSTRFYNAAGSFVGEYYNYYQNLPAFITANFTDNDLEKYIKFASGSNYNTSKLKGIATDLIKIQKEEKINAAIMLAIAINESGWGTSKFSLENNNLFGLAAYDGTGTAAKFTTPGDSIKALAKDYFNNRYIPNKGWTAYGAALGSKQYGFNVKYASDPYWGIKAARHYYNLEQYLANNGSVKAKAEIKVKHKAALTLNETVHVYKTASTTTIIDTFKRKNSVVAISSETAPAGWHKIILQDKTGYIKASDAKVINTIK